MIFNFNEWKLYVILKELLKYLSRIFLHANFEYSNIQYICLSVPHHPCVCKMIYEMGSVLRRGFVWTGIRIVVGGQRSAGHEMQMCKKSNNNIKDKKKTKIKANTKAGCQSKCKHWKREENGEKWVEKQTDSRPAAFVP